MEEDLKMDSKERVMKSLNYGVPDRIARFDEYWPEFKDIVVEKYGLPNDTDLQDYFDVDIRIAAPDESFFPLKKEILEETDAYVIERSGWGSLWKHKKGGYFYEFIEPCIKEPEDLDNVRFDPADLDARYIDWEKEVKAQKMNGRCVFGKIGGPYIRTGFMRGEANFLMDIAGDPSFAKEMAERSADLLLEIGIEEIRRGKLQDTGVWIFDDMGCNNGPMMSPDSFEKIFYPSYKKMVKGLKEAGASKVGLHSDGNIMPLLDMLVDAGIQVLNPIEPKAGMSIEKLMKKYGRKLAYVGGMCNSLVLPFAGKEEIIKKTMEILDVAKNGGVVIGSHSIGPDIPVENYLAYYNTVMEYGKSI
jgi:uroporphyrinogen decarboxylase